eukprot:g6409.t1
MQPPQTAAGGAAHPSQVLDANSRPFTDVDQDLNRSSFLDSRILSIQSRAKVRKWESLHIDPVTGILKRKPNPNPNAGAAAVDEQRTTAATSIRRRNEQVGGASSSTARSKPDDHGHDKGSLDPASGGAEAFFPSTTSQHTTQQHDRESVLRYVMLVLDYSKDLGSDTHSVWKPTNREGLEENALDFVTFFHKKNPLAMLGVMLCGNGSAEVVLPVSGAGRGRLSVQQKRAELAKILLRKCSGVEGRAGGGRVPAVGAGGSKQRQKPGDDPEGLHSRSPPLPAGYFSLQRCIEKASAELSRAPAYGRREILLLTATLTTHDPLHKTIEQHCVDTLRKTNAKLHVVSVTPEIRILKAVSSSYKIASNADVFRQMLLSHLDNCAQEPGAATRAGDGVESSDTGGAKTSSVHLVRMGFPPQIAADRVESRHECPDCGDIASEVPSKCDTCGIYLVDGTALVEARATHSRMARFRRIEYLKELQTQRGSSSLVGDPLLRAPRPPNLHAQVCWGCQQADATTCCPRCWVGFCASCAKQVQLYLSSCPGCTCSNGPDPATSTSGGSWSTVPRGAVDHDPPDVTGVPPRAVVPVPAPPSSGGFLTVLVVDLNPFFWLFDADIALLLPELPKLVKFLPQGSGEHYVSVLATFGGSSGGGNGTPSTPAATAPILRFRTGSTTKTKPAVIRLRDLCVLPPVPTNEFCEHWPTVAMNLRAALDSGRVALVACKAAEQVQEVDAAQRIAMANDAQLAAALGKALCLLSRFSATVNGANRKRKQAYEKIAASAGADHSTAMFDEPFASHSTATALFDSDEALLAASASALLGASSEDEDLSHSDGSGHLLRGRIIVFDASVNRTQYSGCYDGFFKTVLAAKRQGVRIDLLRWPIGITAVGKNLLSSGSAAAQKSERDQQLQCPQHSLLLAQAAAKTSGRIVNLSGNLHETLALYALLVAPSPGLCRNALAWKEDFKQKTAPAGEQGVNYGGNAGINGTRRREAEVEDQEARSLATVCQCHGHLVESGYVCSCCLTVYCAPQAKCAVCGARFLPCSGPLWKQLVRKWKAGG